MALEVPVKSVLTESQAELTSKITSMKGLLSNTFRPLKKTSKSRQVSSFDYLKEIISSMGYSPEFIFQTFFSYILDETGTFLEEKIVSAISQQLAVNGTKLPGTINTSNIPPSVHISPIFLLQESANFNTNLIDERIIAAVKEVNINYINTTLASLGLTNFLQTAKQKIVKDLTLAIFGPKDGAAAEYLNSNAQERARIISNAVCASDAFSLSNKPTIRDEDIEYNRIQLQKQLEQGEVILEISCQDVKIKLPEDPKFIFEGGGQYTVGSTPITPAQSIEILGKYVEGRTQQINNESNKDSAGNSFMQILIEKFLSNITNLVFPYLGPVIQTIQGTPAGAAYTPESLITNTCEILNNTSSNPNKKQFGENLANEIYKQLIKMMMLFVVKEFKRIAKNYFVAIAKEKIKRKQDKLKNKYPEIVEAEQKAKKTERYLKAVNELRDILDV